MDEHAASLAKLIHGRARRLYRDLEELRRLTAELVQLTADTPTEGDTTNGRNNGSPTEDRRAEAEAGVTR